MNISRLFYKATGIMPKKEIVRTCKNIGKDISNELNTGDTVNPTRVQEILTKYIGKKKAAKIEISEDFDTFKKYAQSVGMSNDLATMYFLGSESAVLQNPKNFKILLSLRTSDMPTNEAVNTTAHELEHVLFQGLSPNTFLEKMKIKLRGQKWVERYKEKYSEVINAKNMEMQQSLAFYSNIGDSAIGGYVKHPLTEQGLHAQMNLSKNRSLRSFLNDFIKEQLENPADKRLNIKTLKNLRTILREEARAYKVGGATERYFDVKNGIVNPNPTKSEMCAAIYEKTSEEMTKRIKEAKKNWLKSLFKRTSKEPKVLSETVNPDGSITREILVKGKKQKVTARVMEESEIPPELLEYLNETKKEPNI